MPQGTIWVIAEPGLTVTWHNDNDKIIDDQTPQEVPDIQYYRQAIANGELREVDPPA